MKEKATFLSYISAEKKLRKEQLKKKAAASKSNSDTQVLDQPVSFESKTSVQASFN